MIRDGTGTGNRQVGSPVYFIRFSAFIIILNYSKFLLLFMVLPRGCIMGTLSFRPLQFVRYYFVRHDSSEMYFVRFHFVLLQFVLIKFCPNTFRPMTYGPPTIRPNFMSSFYISSQKLDIHF